MSNTIGIQDKQINEIAFQHTCLLYSYNYEGEKSFPENTAFHNFADALLMLPPIVIVFLKTQPHTKQKKKWYQI